MNWSEIAWQEAIPVYEKIVKMPFLMELSEGSLPVEKFRFYIQQDSCYLEHFGRTLAMIGAKANNIDDALTFMQFAANAIIVEKALHASYFHQLNISDERIIEPACHHYIHFLKSTAAYDPVEVAMAAVLPCFWIYKKVGDHIYTHQAGSHNPYQQWIDAYAGEEFEKIVTSAIEVCDNAASQSTNAVRDAMTNAFLTACKLEYDFWDAAYTLRRFN